MMLYFFISKADKCLLDRSLITDVVISVCRIGSCHEHHAGILAAVVFHSVHSVSLCGSCHEHRAGILAVVVFHSVHSASLYGHHHQVNTCAFWTRFKQIADVSLTRKDIKHYMEILCL